MPAITDFTQGDSHIRGSLFAAGDLNFGGAINGPSGAVGLLTTPQTFSAASKQQILANFAKTLIIPINGTLVTADDTDTDIGSAAIPAEYARWKYLRSWLVAKTGASTMAASVLLIRTAADGGGTALTASLTCTGLTAANKTLDFTAASLTDTFTASTLYLRQTTDSVNAGTVTAYVEIALVD